MALVIAGERSGVGKTTVTLALLSSLRQRQLRVQSFKVGPDYIDPMFHQYVTGRACRNLDPVLTSETYVQHCFARHIQDSDYALVEGVMGLFDGVSLLELQVSRLQVEGSTLPSNFASTAHVARLLNLPVLLVIDCSRLSGSVAAIAQGYRYFDSRIQLIGVVLNRVGSDRHLELLKDALEPLELPILGVLRRQDNITIPDRHLGLVPTAELPEMDALINQLAQLGDSCFDWEQLLPLLQVEKSSKISVCELDVSFDPPHPPFLRGEQESAFLSVNDQLLLVEKQAKSRTRIAVARDRAFNFYYQDNLDLLQQLGAELVFWSPLSDAELPHGVSGLYFGGGFPEVFAQQLTENCLARETVHAAISAGMPTYAECGGLMYLCEQIIDFDGNSWQMVGILPTSAEMGSRLTLGYRQAVALQDTPLLSAGETVWGHEFHRSQLNREPEFPLFQIQGFSSHTSAVKEGWQRYRLHASYVHLHFGAHPKIAAQFLQHCQQFDLRVSAE